MRSTACAARTSSASPPRPDLTRTRPAPINLRARRRGQTLREPRSHPMNARDLRREAMRIGGKPVHTDRVIEVFNPYTEQLIGTVPKASVEDVKRAFSIAKAYKSKLTRYERAAILNKAAAIIRSRLDEFSDLIT